MKKLTEEEWKRVFEIRQRAKRGVPLSEDELDFLDKAWIADRTRYMDMSKRVHKATKPFGA